MLGPIATCPACHKRVDVQPDGQLSPHRVYSSTGTNPADLLRDWTTCNGLDPRLGSRDDLHTP